MLKPATPKGVRDFLPAETAVRNWLFDTIRGTFARYGFAEIDTPAFERLDILTEKYGEEGTKLLFRIVNSGDYLKNAPDNIINEKNSAALLPHISEKGLRYDLTVPLARYAAQHRNELAFPFRRFHIGKVWRADRPQKGRYQEFVQCDADIIGSPSLMCDAECILLFDEVLAALGLPGFAIHLNNRKILYGIAEGSGFADKFDAFAIVVDKWDKIGENGVLRELSALGLSETQMHALQRLFRLEGEPTAILDALDREFAQTSPTGADGARQLREVLGYLKDTPLRRGKLKLDMKLARGLDYYTATIFEVAFDKPGYGSIASGGRYDELTATFGMPDMPGVGISFGAERIFDILAEEGLLPAIPATQVKVLIANFGEEEARQAFGLLQQLRQAGIAAELYPTPSKLDKQFKYADKKGIPYLLMAGSEELKSGLFGLKNLTSGQQEKLALPQITAQLNG